MLAFMSFAMSYSWKKEKEEITRIKNSYNGIWYAFECILFVLIGAEVNISYSLFSGPRGLLLITLALIVRSIGVYISLLPSKLDSKEKLFVIISYLPKATVQAAIGAIPLSLGLANGELILSIAVLGILITAPIGAIGINSTYKKLLKKEVR